MSRRVGHRGLPRPGGGFDPFVEPAPEWRASTSQACGLYPFATSGESPMIGVPLGRNLLTGATVCCDPLNWFRPARILPQPSQFVLGLPALGKSSLVRRQIIGLAASGVTAICAGDLKPDYAALVGALGGQVITIGRGRGQLNPLDPGTLADAATRLSGSARELLREEAHTRRLTMVIALLSMIRSAGVSDTEAAVLAAALRLLADRHTAADPPILTDLVGVLDDGPDPVRALTLDRGDDSAYRAAVDPLHRSLLALIDGELGTVFAGQTTTRLSLEAPAVCVDVSGLAGYDEQLTAAVLLATWGEAYGTVWAANALADAGVAPQRHTVIVLDELWRVLAAGPGMVDRINTLGRTNRQEGVGQIAITHTMADLNALQAEHDRAKARGFIERSALLMLGGLPRHELDTIDDTIVRLSQAEKTLVASWNTPASITRNAAPPGRGKFLIKIANRPGIPVQVQLTSAELHAGVHDTDTRWKD